MPSTILGQGWGCHQPEGRGRGRAEQTGVLGSWGGAAIRGEWCCKPWRVRKGREGTWDRDRKEHWLGCWKLSPKKVLEASRGTGRQGRLASHRGLRSRGPKVPSGGMRSWGGFQAAEPLGGPWGEGLWPRPAGAGEGEGDREGEETRAEKGGSSSPKRLTREPRGRAGLRLGSRRGRRGLEAPPASAAASVSVMEGSVLSEQEPRLSERGCGQRGQLVAPTREATAPRADTPSPAPTLLPPKLWHHGQVQSPSPYPPTPGRARYLRETRRSGKAAGTLRGHRTFQRTQTPALPWRHHPPAHPGGPERESARRLGWSGDMGW